jgi:antirestriction protein ArdC
MRDLYTEVTEKIVAALETGTAPWARSWTGTNLCNGLSGYKYNGINVLLLGMRGFSDHRFYTFNQAKTLGAFVRKGEKGTMIVKWLFFKNSSEEKDTPEESGVVASGKIRPVLKAYTVFNHTQIEWAEGKENFKYPAPVISADTDVSGKYAPVSAFATSVPANVEHNSAAAPCYMPALDKISIPWPASFHSADAYWSTRFHETVHWTGAPSRLNRDLLNRFGSEKYAAEELVAEMGSAFLCAEFGITNNLQHAEYIGSWIKILKKDKFAIFTAVRKANEAVKSLLKTEEESEVETDMAA